MRTSNGDGGDDTHGADYSEADQDDSAIGDSENDADGDDSNGEGDQDDACSLSDDAASDGLEYGDDHANGFSHDDT